MHTTASRPADSWSPLYYLASVGAGGLAVTFFMYLMFWVPHKGQPVPVFEDIVLALQGASPLFALAIGIALLGVAFFAAMNLWLLAWNLKRTGEFHRSDAGRSLKQSNAETQLAAMPLALAMSINVLFIVGLVFVPRLWSIVEYMFPAALVAFLAVGALALRQIGQFLTRAIAHGGFDCAKNNSLAQLLPAFTLAMVGVGLSAPGAMSVNPAVTGVSVILSSFFLTGALLLAAIKLVLGVRAMLEHGIAVEQAPTLMIVIPITTVLAILLLRQSHGLHVHFESHTSPGDMLTLLTRLLSVEVLFALFGMTILNATGYIRRFITGHEVSVGSYALICPGVALSVLGHFWINKGLVASGLIAKFGSVYWGLTGIALASQVAMIVLFAVLHRRHFLRWNATTPLPAE